MASEELRVEITQQFVDGTPDLQKPTLKTVLIGDHYQIEEGKALGDFSGSSISPAYPDLKTGAVVDLTSVQVSIVDPLGTFILTDGSEATPGLTSIVIAATGAGTPASPGSALMRRAVTRVSSSTGVGTSGVVVSGTQNYSDTSVNFITKGVVAGDQLTIAAPSANAGVYYVGVLSATSLELYTDTALTTKAALSANTTGDSYVIVNDYALSGALLVDYTARRNDLVGVLKEIDRQQDIEPVAGLADTRNPLGLAAALYNTAAPGTSFFVTALAANDAAGHLSALGVIENEDVYSIVPLVQNTQDLDIATLYSQHVIEESKPENGRFRIAFVSRDTPSILSRVKSTALPLANGDFDAGAGANEIDLTDSSADFVADGVLPGDALTVSGSDITAQNATWLIKTVTPTVITVIGTTSGPNTVDIVYEINSQSLTLSEQATFLSDYAKSLANRRLVNVVAGRGEVQTTFTGSSWVPSYYVGAVLSGLVSFLPPQQGLSRLVVPGITDIRNPIAGKFVRANLNTIGSGGNFIIEKPTTGSLVTIRRQRSTSTFTACEAELSCTKDVDYASFYIDGALSDYLGKTNIVDSFFSMAQATLDTVRYNLTTGSLPGIGPVLTKFTVVSFKPGVEAGTVELIIDIEVPFPVNVIRVTLIVK
jgi:hypothetical protein